MRTAPPSYASCRQVGLLHKVVDEAVMEAATVAAGVEYTINPDEKNRTVGGGGDVHGEGLHLCAGKGFTEYMRGSDSGHDTAVAVVIGTGDADLSLQNNAQVNGTVALGKYVASFCIGTEGTVEAVNQG